MSNTNNISLNIQHDNNELSIDEAIIFYKDVEQGYTHSCTDMVFKSVDFDKFIDYISDLYSDEMQHGELKLFDYTKNTNNIHKKYINDKFIIYARGGSLELFVSFYTKEEIDNQKLWNVYKKYHTPESEIEMFMTSYSLVGGRIDENTKPLKYKDIEYISKLYYPYIDVDLMFDQFFTGDENILLVVGEPGLGKSKLGTMALKYAFENSNKIPYDKIEDNPSLPEQFIDVAIVKSVEVLANDNFWRILEKTHPDFCIIDDLDYMLTKRDTEVTIDDDKLKNSFLNQFLSFTDGVEKYKTKFIITTNQSYKDIDKALLRKGRLFDILELRRLSYNEALDIWLEHGLNENEFKEIFNTDDYKNILSAELGSEISKRLNNRISNSCKNYLFESDISKIKDSLENKRIGL